MLKLEKISHLHMADYKVNYCMLLGGYRGAGSAETGEDLTPPPGRPYSVPFHTVFRIRSRIQIHQIHMFLGLQDPDPDPLVRGMDPDLDPDPSIIMQN